jgi:iron complex outermembrane receptor protein
VFLCLVPALLAASELPEVLVTTAPPVPGTVTLSGDDLKAAPGASLADILLWSGEADVARRGEALADLNLQASTFEQTGVLLDGFPLRDPQTGHFALDLPLPPSALESVEFSPVPWGGRGLAGSVGFTTRAPRERQATLSGSMGSFGRKRGRAFLAFPRAAAWGEEYRTDGHRHGTDLRARSAGGTLETPSLLGSRVTTAWSERRFGADDFYGNYPKFDEWEETRNLFVSWRGRLTAGEGALSPGLYWRRHEDLFLLDRMGRSSYRNRHVTRVLGTGTRYDRGDLRAALHARAEDLDSSNLGRRRRGSGGASAWVTRENASLGMEVDLLGRGHVQACPILSAHTWILPDVRLDGSISRSYREPSFTEIFYQDPQNLGSADLRSETAWNYRLSPSWVSGELSATGSAFLRLERDLIDWVRVDASRPWRALNVGTAVVRGAGARAEWKPAGFVLRADYDFLEREADLAGLASKYALNHPRHKAELRGRATFGFFGLSARGARYWRTDRQVYDLVEGRLTAGFGNGTVFAGVANMLDEDYREVTGVPMPGRSVEYGVEITF